MDLLAKIAQFIGLWVSWIWFVYFIDYAHNRKIDLPHKTKEWNLPKFLGGKK